MYGSARLSIDPASSAEVMVHLTHWLFCVPAAPLRADTTFSQVWGLSYSSGRPTQAVWFLPHPLSFFSVRRLTTGPGEGAKATLHVAETQGPPSQDPGNDNETPTGHNRHLHPSKIAQCKPMN